MAKKGVKQTPEHVQKRLGHLIKRCRCIETGKEWSSLAECAREVGMTYVNLSNAIHQHRTTRKGTFEFID